MTPEEKWVVTEAREAAELGVENIAWNCVDTGKELILGAVRLARVALELRRLRGYDILHGQIDKLQREGWSYEWHQPEAVAEP